MHISKADLAAIAARKLTKTALAKRLGVSPTYITKITPKLSPGPIRQQRLATADLANTRKAFRTKLARQVIAGRRNLASAAREAHCSTRTMYRYICKLKTK
jgi:transcriptional regulator with XRE-family HTH domain